MGDARLRARSVVVDEECAHGRRGPLGLLTSSLALWNWRRRCLLAAAPVITFMALQFTLMARDCFDALQNWSNEHAYVKVDSLWPL